MERKPFIELTRLEAIMDAHKKGVKSTDLPAAAVCAERKITDRRGGSSVNKFLSIVKNDRIPMIERLQDSTHKEDVEWHTDRWVVLKKPVQGRRMFPVEIKSSEYGVREVKQSKDFIRSPICIVINCNKRRSDQEIISDFSKELERIASVLDKLTTKKNT